jgi:hypothetical protein
LKSGGAFCKCWQSKVVQNYAFKASQCKPAVFQLCFEPTARVARWFIFSPKFQFGHILEGLGLENVGLFYNRLEYFTVIW